MTAVKLLIFSADRSGNNVHKSMKTRKLQRRTTMTFHLKNEQLLDQGVTYTGRTTKDLRKSKTFVSKMYMKGES